MVQLLIAFGSDITAKNGHDQTALDVAWLMDASKERDVILYVLDALNRDTKRGIKFRDEVIFKLSRKFYIRITILYSKISP